MRRLTEVLKSGGIAVFIGLIASSASAFDDTPGSPFGEAASVTQEALGTERAMGAPVVEFGDVTQSNNTITGGGIGTNSVSMSAFSGAACVSCTVMQNTGNGAVMQHATVIQLGTVPAP